MNDLIDRFMDGAGCIVVIGGLIVLLVIAMIVSAVGNVDAEKEFMTECQQKHEHFECTAMWRAGESHEQVVPMPIIIPSGR